MRSGNPRQIVLRLTPGEDLFIDRLGGRNVLLPVEDVRDKLPCEHVVIDLAKGGIRVGAVLQELACRGILAPVVTNDAAQVLHHDLSERRGGNVAELPFGMCESFERRIVATEEPESVCALLPGRAAQVM